MNNEYHFFSRNYIGILVRQVDSQTKFFFFGHKNYLKITPLYQIFLNDYSMFINIFLNTPNQRRLISWFTAFINKLNSV